MKRIESRLAADTRYVEPHNGSSPLVARSVLVRGWHRGVATETEVSDEDAAFLAAHPHFQEHAARGFVKIVEAG